MCSLSRYLVVAGFAGIAASSLTRSDLFGLLAAALAVLVILGAERPMPSRLRRGSCALPTPAAQDAPAAAATTERSDTAHR